MRGSPARPVGAHSADRFIFLALVLLAQACAPASASASIQSPEIDQADVERIVRTLAADDMRGREAFSEDANRAADFLAGEFASAGLESLDGVDGYQQRFAARTLTPRDARVRIDGRELFPNEFAFRPGSGSISWSTGDVPLVVVGPDDEAFSVINSVAFAGFDALVLVNDIHGEVFRQVVQIFRRSVRTLADTVGASVVVALANATPDATFQVSAVADVVEEPLRNVVGMIPGRRSDEYVLFSAHYDHLGVLRPFRGDSIANGANDNASGTAAVVSLAKYFARRGTPERTLLFAAFTAEEGGGYGSRYFSRQLDPDRIVAMFNIEMIGKPSARGPNTAWITGFDRSSFGPILQEAVDGTPYSFYPDPYPTYDLFYRSDNATLARLGVPAHSISTTPIDVDENYHQVSDEIDTLDLAHLTSTIRAIARGAETIVSGRETPTRVELEAGN
ncbi:MAG TPA: M20/M25/M40 family metallo-hydrolase [Longimicrobiales bacterium]|nr:M20/M25/M40 family metallo-hydrolase [Longimicrobiales bacterium]